MIERFSERAVATRAKLQHRNPRLCGKGHLENGCMCCMLFFLIKLVTHYDFALI